MKTETYEVWLLRYGEFYFWTGRKWDMRPYNAKCYAMKKTAEKAMPAAAKRTTEQVEVVPASMTVPIGCTKTGE